MRRGAPKRESNFTYEHLWPEETCPVCGKKFMRRCKRSEWGYYYNDSPSQLTSTLTLLCSGPCSKEYARRKFMESVRAVLKTRTGQVFRLMAQEGLSQREAKEIAGIRYTNSISQFEAEKWQELEWLKAHDWKVEGTA